MPVYSQIGAVRVVSNQDFHNGQGNIFSPSLSPGPFQVNQNTTLMSNDNFQLLNSTIPHVPEDDLSLNLTQ